MTSPAQIIIFPGVRAERLPCCPYCLATEGLRIASDGRGGPDYICEGCFTPADDGPCFDDLAPINPWNTLP